MHTAEVFKALGDPVRLRLFYLLSQGKELCVCHLTEALELPQSTVSRHLAVLRQAGIVDTRREGKWIHYHLIPADPVIAQLSRVVKANAEDEKQLQFDRANLKSSPC